jgi:hypothetical protein
MSVMSRPESSVQVPRGKIAASSNWLERIREMVTGVAAQVVLCRLMLSRQSRAAAEGENPTAP